MSYILLNDFGKKDRGLKFNQISLEVYTKNVNIEAIQTSSIYATFFAGLEGNRYAKREEADYTFEDVCEWVDELYEKGRKEDIKRVCDLWAETHVYREWLKEFQDKVRSTLEPEENKKNKKKVK